MPTLANSQGFDSRRRSIAIHLLAMLMMFASTTARAQQVSGAETVPAPGSPSNADAAPAAPTQNPTAAAPVAPTAARSSAAQAGTPQADQPGASDSASTSGDPPLVGDAWGGSADGMRVGFISFRFLMQARYTSTFAASSNNTRATYRVAEDALARDGDGASLQRFFVRIGVDPSDYLELKTIVDLAELVHDNADSAVKQAYATLKPIPKHLELTVGVFKLPFSILELDPIAEFRFADVGQADTLVKSMGFAGRDIGAELMVAPLSKAKHLRIALGAFRGHAHDENGSLIGAVGARIETRPWKGLRFGIDWVEHPRQIVYQNSLETSNKDLVPNPVDPQYPRAETWTRGRALSADAKFQRYHWLAAVEAMIGTRVDFDTRYEAGTFAAIWMLAGYRFRLGPVHLTPAVRAAWLDADREHAVGLRRELAFALNVDFSKSVRFLLDVTRTDVQANSPLLDQPKPLPESPYYELDNTRLVGQLQVAL